jgi:hypothetical protein
MAKSKRKKSKEEEGTTHNVVHFVDYVNYTEVAAIITAKVEKLCKSSKQMAFIFQEDGFDLELFADVLENAIDPEMLEEFIGSDVGAGILAGIYLMSVERENQLAEIEALERQETGDYE